MKKLVLILFAISLFLPIFAQTGNFTWPPRKYPVDIPFKIIQDIKYWEIKSITCIGLKKGSNAYRFKIQGIGLEGCKDLSMGSCSVSFAPEEKGSNKINSSYVGAYFLPAVDVGEPFETEITALFPGYYNKAKFAGFLIFQ